MGLTNIFPSCNDDCMVKPLHKTTTNQKTMQAILNTKSFLTAIKTAATVVPKRPVHAILSNLKIESENDSIKIAATDLTSFLTLYLTGYSDPGQCLVGSRSIMNLAKVAPIGEIELQVIDSILKINGTYDLPTADPGEFPDFPKIGSTQSFTVDSCEFVKAFNSIAPHVKPDGYVVCTELAGVHLANGHLWASDNHKLAYVKLNAIGDQPSAILYPNLGKLIAKICPENRLISIEISDKYVRVLTPNGELIQRLIDGRVLAEDRSMFVGSAQSDLPITCNKKSLVKALELAKLCQSQSENKLDTVWLAVSNDGSQIEIESEYSKDSILLENQVTAMSGVFSWINVNYVLTILKTISDETLTITIPSNPEKIVALNSGDMNFGVMPVSMYRLSNLVTAKGHGFAPAWDLPYRHDNGVMIVTDNRYGFERAQEIPQPEPKSTHSHTQPKPNRKPTETPEQIAEREEAYRLLVEEEKIHAKEFFLKESTELLESCFCDIKSTEKLLRKQYKKIATYKSTFTTKFFWVSEEERTWTDIAEDYRYRVNVKYLGIVQEILEQREQQPTPEPQAEPQASTTEDVIESVTVEFLKGKYNKFSDAKEATGYKARSWQALADKINQRAGAHTQPTPEAATEIESKIVELKAKYGKFSAAKSALKMKAASWAKLAEMLMAA